MKQWTLFLLLFTNCVFAQSDSSWNKRSWLVTGTNVAIGGGSIALLNSVWYKDYPKSDFHLFNDANEWLQMDKVGHSYTAYILSNAEYAAWRWAKLPRKKAIWLSGGIAWTYQLSVEVMDGYSAQWGFSLVDLTANTLGAGLFIGQQLAWDQQRFQLKFGYNPSPYADLRPSVLGSNFTESLLKDYNAQSYWLCVSPGSFFSESNFPKWIQVGVGYSIDGKLNGDLNTYSLNGINYTAHREWAISLDIDWAQLPIKRKWVKNVLKPLNAIKIPFPSVYWRNGVCYVGMM